MTTQLNLALGRQRAQEGAEQAAYHADRVHAAWQMRALSMFFTYMLEHPGKTFMTEDVRWWAEDRGLPEPPDRRAWGAVTMAAKRRKMIRFFGYAPQKAANAHGSPKSVWVACHD